MALQLTVSFISGVSGIVIKLGFVLITIFAKLDGVAFLITDPPTISLTTWSEKNDM